MSQRKRAVICFDGLNQEQLSIILKDMPKLNALIGSGETAELDSSPFTEVQPIWAEILTGEPWYRNGCTGYAKPLRSLNQLAIFQESDLLAPIRLFDDGDNGLVNVLINAPIVQKLDGKRVWLSSGSVPSNQLVAPIAMAQNPVLAKYEPRPIVSMGSAMAEGKEALSLFIDAEINNLSCAKVLASDTDWKFFLYRTTVFDQLSHLLGSAFLQQKRLAIASRLKELLLQMDDVVAQILIDAEQKILLSSFSHINCEGIFSLNDALERARLLSRASDSTNSEQLRLSALAAAQSSEDEPSQPVTVTKSKKYAPQRTLCASPIKGTIFLNTADRFDDGGQIDAVGLACEEVRVAEFLRA